MRQYQKPKQYNSVLKGLRNIFRTVGKLMSSKAKQYQPTYKNLSFIVKKAWQMGHPELMKVNSKTVGDSRQQRRAKAYAECKSYFKKVNKGMRAEGFSNREYKRWRAFTLSTQSV